MTESTSLEHDGAARVDPLADDLRRVAGSRSPKALRDAHLPTLQGFLDGSDDPDRHLDRIREVVENGVAAIADPQFKSAAEELFGFGDHRWTPLRTRGERASASFGCSFDAYRRARRSTGTSLLDETIEQLANAIRTHAEPTVAIPDESTIESSPNPATSDSNHRRLVPLAATVAVMAVAALVIVALTIRKGDHGREAAATPAVTTATPSVERAAQGQCHYPIGKANDPKLVAYTKAFINQIDQVTPPGDPQPCGAAAVGTWGALTIQPLTVKGRPDGTLVAVDPDHVIQMTEAEFNSYHQIGGKNGNQAQTLAGLPRRRATTTSGKIWLIITDNGAMVSQGVDQPGFYVGGPAWTRWKASGEDTGEMGFPTSNPLNNAVGYYQDYSRGRLTLSYSGTLSFDPVDNPSAGLPANFRGQILRHDDGTTWFVDSKMVRHWIPDGETWMCLHDRGAKELGGIPGYSIATLHLGDPATCDLDS